MKTASIALSQLVEDWERLGRPTYINRQKLNGRQLNEHLFFMIDNMGICVYRQSMNFPETGFSQYHGNHYYSLIYLRDKFRIEPDEVITSLKAALYKNCCICKCDLGKINET